MVVKFQKIDMSRLGIKRSFIIQNPEHHIITFKSYLDLDSVNQLNKWCDKTCLGNYFVNSYELRLEKDEDLVWFSLRWGTE